MRRLIPKCLNGNIFDSKSKYRAPMDIYFTKYMTTDIDIPLRPGVRNKDTNDKFKVGVNPLGEYKFPIGINTLDNYLYYTVKDNDTLTGISKKTRIPVQLLIENNPEVLNPNYIIPGQQLRTNAIPQFNAPKVELVYPDLLGPLYGGEPAYNVDSLNKIYIPQYTSVFKLYWTDDDISYLDKNLSKSKWNPLYALYTLKSESGFNPYKNNINDVSLVVGLGLFTKATLKTIFGNQEGSAKYNRYRSHNVPIKELIDDVVKLYESAYESLLKKGVNPNSYGLLKMKMLGSSVLPSDAFDFLTEGTHAYKVFNKSLTDKLKKYILGLKNRKKSLTWQDVVDMYNGEYHQYMSSKK